MYVRTVVHNVARVWCYETAVCVDQHNNIDNDIPYHNYYEYFSDGNYELHLLPQKHMVNENTQGKIDEIRTDLLQQLQDLQGAPGGPIMYEVPPLYERLYDVEEDNDDDDNDDDEKLDQGENDGQGDGIGKRHDNNEGDSQGGSTTSAPNSIKKKRKFKKKVKKPHESELYDQVD